MHTRTHALEPARCRGGTIVFGGTNGRGGTATWTLTLNDSYDGAFDVAAELEEVIRFTDLRWWWRSERKRQARIDQGLGRLKGFAEAVARHGDSRLEPGDMVALLNAYTTQFGSYTSLLWQVPTIGLTAQAFLMTIVLGGDGYHAQYLASALSIVIAYASVHLMHDQRARAINHAELAKRISYRLSLLFAAIAALVTISLLSGATWFAQMTVSH
jgi:hypothetical protein